MAFHELTNPQLDAGLFELGARLVEHLAAKEEGLGEINQEDSRGEVMLSNALRAEYLLVRIALVRPEPLPSVTGENFDHKQGMETRPYRTCGSLLRTTRSRRTKDRPRSCERSDRPVL